MTPAGLEYKAVCREEDCVPHEAVLEQIDLSLERDGKVVFSRFSFPPQTCSVLGKLLRKPSSSQIKHIIMNDCMLKPEYVIYIAEGLSLNSSVETLELKGNNIRGLACEALGRFLQVNSKIRRLNLEWNSLGSSPGSFAVFCEGVGRNESLKYLDIRNNQIKVDAAEDLASLIRRNSTLQYIDLRWNEIGLIGGRKISAAMKQNRHLQTLCLTGNDIPEEVLAAIAAIAQGNKERTMMRDHQEAQLRSAKFALESLERERKDQVKKLLHALKGREQDLSNVQRSKAVLEKEMTTALRENEERMEELKKILRQKEQKLTVLLPVVGQVSHLKDGLQSLRQEVITIVSSWQKDSEDMRRRFGDDLLSQTQSCIDLRKALSVMEAENQRLKYDLSMSQNETAAILEEKEDQRRGLEEALEAQRKRWQEQLQTKEAKFSSEKEVILADYQKVVEDLQATVDTAKEERKKLADENHTLQADLQRKDGEHKKQIVKLQEEYQARQAEREQLWQEKCSGLEIRLEKSEAYVRHLLKEVSEAQNQALSSQLKMEETIRVQDSVKKEMEKVQRGVEAAVERAVGEFSDEVKALTSELQKKGKELENESNKVKSLQRDLEARKGEIERLQGTILDKVDEISHLKNEEKERQLALKSALMPFLTKDS